MKSKSLEPPTGGTVFRSSGCRQCRLSIAQAFASMNATHTRRDISKHPTMQRTQTTDYIVLLSGKVWLVLDEEERDLEPFDVVVQRGPNHAWVTTGLRNS